MNDINLKLRMKFDNYLNELGTQWFVSLMEVRQLDRAIFLKVSDPHFYEFLLKEFAEIYSKTVDSTKH